MSAVGTTEVLRPILLRSSTPASNEKVLNYLEGMAREESDPAPPPSMIDHMDDNKSRVSHVPRSHVYSPVPRSHHSEALHELANSPVSYGHAPQHQEDQEDMDSNAQQRSEPDDSALPMREPGPNDPPGPRYESYDSGPSFGNFGPLPNDDPYHSSNTYGANFSTWTPEWNQPAKPASTIGLDMNNWKSPNFATKVPLPESRIASPRPTSVNIGIESPSTTSRHAQSQVAPSHKSRSAASPTPQPKKATSRAASPPVQSPTDSSSSPISPVSRKSHVTGRKTENGTAYPALPESHYDGTEYERVASPTKSKAHTQRSKAAASVVSAGAKSHTRHQPNGDAPRGANPNARQQTAANGTHSPPPSVLSGGGHQSRPFSPYRHAPTQSDLLYAATRGRALVIPDTEDRQSTKERSRSRSKTRSAAPPPVVEPLSPPASPRSRPHSKAPSHMSFGGKQSVTPSARTGVSKVAKSKRTEKPADGNITPTPSRPGSPLEELDEAEAKIVRDTLTNGLTPRTSYAASTLEGEAAPHSQYHDAELCVLFAQLNNPDAHEIVKKAIRKAVRQRVKRLGMKYDNESIKAYQRHHSHHGPPLETLLEEGLDEPPKWASDIKRELVVMQQRIESLGPKIENLRPLGSQNGEASRYYEGGDEYTSQTPRTQTVNIHTQPTGTLADSMYKPPDTELLVDGDDDLLDDAATETQRQDGYAPSNRSAVSHLRANNMRDDSPGQQYLEEELYKLRQRRSRGQGSEVASHQSWHLVGDNDEDEEEEHEEQEFEEDLEGGDGDDDLLDQEEPVTIPGSEAYEGNARATSPPLPPVPEESSERGVVPTPRPYTGEFGNDSQLPPWQKIHQRLLTWAITWPLNAIDAALNSTTRGHQVDEVALSVWSTQTYKRYVRSRLTDRPQGVVDRLFVPPNVADAISNAVFHGRHGDACGMLRDLWSPFGLEGMPRLLVVLAKHRSDESHWVVHRFSLPDGSLTTYDTYPERTLPDGRPLGWWFAIRVAWPNAIYPSPDHLMQKMVRLHRPMQLAIDNSVSAAGIWRNILMGSRAERSLDLERLRDLVNTEVKNLRQRKLMGKLSIAPPRPAWEDMS